MRQIIMLLLIILSVSGCTVVEGIHVYFNKELRIVSAKHSEFFDCVAVANNERLSEIAYKLTGSRNTKYIRAANPNLKSEFLTAGTVIHVPNILLKPGMRLQARLNIRSEQEMEQPLPKKDLKKLKLPGNKEVEILPRKGDQDSEKDDIYDSTPFHTDEKEIIPYVPPKPTPDKQQIEDEKLRDQYKDIMKQLEQ